MATELVTFKADDKFIKEVDNVAKSAGFQNRTEFIRTALREKVDTVKLKQAMSELAHLKGSLRKGRQTTDKELEEIRQKVFEEFDRKLK
jgi:metal-responsive CopG/Arc/MetJ family transcriptional regulator